jgi:hypothetical protein
MNTPTPELDYQSLIIESGQPELLAKFYDWLRDKNYYLCSFEEGNVWDDTTSGYYPLSIPPEQLFADFFGIDLNKIETERRAILKELRNRQ